MKTVKLTELGDDVRDFLDRSLSSGGVVIEAEDGSECGRLLPLRRVAPEERAAAWKRIQEIQKEVGDKMRARGETEADLDRILQEND